MMIGKQLRKIYRISPIHIHIGISHIIGSCSSIMHSTRIRSISGIKGEMAVIIMVVIVEVIIIDKVASGRGIEMMEGRIVGGRTDIWCGKIHAG